MPMRERFLKKLGEISEKWNHTMKSDKLPGELAEILQRREIELQDFIVFCIVDFTQWFGINTSGIYIFEFEGMIFIDFAKLTKVEIVYSLDNDLSSIKKSANKLKLTTTKNQEYIVTCLDEGAVYSIKRQMDFGRSLSIST
jgi:hypothetical protein